MVKDPKDAAKNKIEFVEAVSPTFRIFSSP
jgi:hypothetical protein